MSERGVLIYMLTLLDEAARANMELSISNTTIWQKRKYRAVAATCERIAAIVRKRASDHSIALPPPEKEDFCQPQPPKE